MCGVHAVITSSDEVPDLSEDLRRALCNRGPDHFGQVERTLAINDLQAFRVTLTSTVLALRGDHIAKQPLEDRDSGSVLCWNGEAWKIDGRIVDSNDGEAISAKLNHAHGDESRRRNHVLSVLRSIQGPFAFLFYDAPGKCVYFGRDRLGRRSLLIKEPHNGGAIAFSSIVDAPSPEWKEVKANGIYSMTFHSQNSSLQDLISKYDWLTSGGTDLVSSIGVFNMDLPPVDIKLGFGSPAVHLLRHHLTEALKLRILNVPKPPHPQSDMDIRIAVLFSGGLDCTVLARLADDLLPSAQGVDLINVAFENPRVAAQLRKNTPQPQAVDVYEACPDRITGRKAFSELKTACPSRYWRFIAVNVPFQEAMAHKSQVVSLIYPHDTEMDLSIALALYFAGRGIGDGYTSQSQSGSGCSPVSVTTPARVLLSGLGADELFGGYSRHTAAFERQGYQGLVDELKLDVARIGQRNLGRDDRVLAHWGKEVRFPYLDENFVKFAVACPVWEKCDFGNHHPTGIEPAKRVLRLLADQLSLPVIAREKKRAIQFGSRTAKLEHTSGRLRGTASISKTTTTS